MNWTNHTTRTLPFYLWSLREHDREAVNMSEGVEKFTQEKAKEIIENLNYYARSNYNYKANDTQKKIRARFEEGFTIEDFYEVNRKKCLQWRDDSKMHRYLKPGTLYAPSHFDDYLNERENGHMAKKERKPIYSEDEEEIIEWFKKWRKKYPDRRPTIQEINKMTRVTQRRRIAYMKSKNESSIPIPIP